MRWMQRWPDSRRPKQRPPSLKRKRKRSRRRLRDLGPLRQTTTLTARMTATTSTIAMHKKMTPTIARYKEIESDGLTCKVIAQGEREKCKRCGGSLMQIVAEEMLNFLWL